jgi:AraC family transcriptional regulator
MSAVPQPLRGKEEIVAKWRNIEGATFLLCDAPRPEHCGLHSHEHVRLSFLLGGNIVEVDDRRQMVECGPLSLHTTPSGMRHAHLIRSERVQTLCFDLHPSLLAQLGEAAAVFREPITVKRGALLTFAPRIQREMVAMDSASDLVMQGLMFELVGELARRKASPLAGDAPPWLRRARELLNDRWNERVSIEAVAAAVGVHPSHLNRVFRQYLRQTPGEYQRRIRIERATREVMATTTPLKAIAAMAGFADQAHFTREFRRYHGMTPLEMRRSVLG